MKRPSKEPSKLSDSVHHQLSMYALAASAAGVGMLALAQPAAAKIIYTPKHVVLKEGSQYRIHLNGVGDVALSNSTHCTQLGSGVTFCLFWLAEKPASPNAAGGNSVVGHLSSRRFRYSASALRPGRLIGKGLQFLGKDQSLLYMYTSSVIGGMWRNVKDRYLGFRFRIKGQLHYGWARLNVSYSGTGNPNITATLTGYAYETIPNKPIITGKTKGPDVITLNPGSLGALAAGASTLHK
jgi:hypothetical protein